MTALAIQRRDEIIAGLAEGKRLSDLNLGVSRQAISKVLKDDPEYRSAIEAGFTARLDEAEKAIENAAEQVDVARARARFQAVAWRAEREFPSRWGQKQEVATTHRYVIEVPSMAQDSTVWAQQVVADGSRVLPHITDAEVVNEPSGS